MGHHSSHDHSKHTGRVRDSCTGFADGGVEGYNGKLVKRVAHKVCCYSPHKFVTDYTTPLSKDLLVHEHPA